MESTPPSAALLRAPVKDMAVRTTAHRHMESGTALNAGPRCSLFHTLRLRSCPELKTLLAFCSSQAQDCEPQLTSFPHPRRCRPTSCRKLSSRQDPCVVKFAPSRPGWRDRDDRRSTSSRMRYPHQSCSRLRFFNEKTPAGMVLCKHLGSSRKAECRTRENGYCEPFWEPAHRPFEVDQCRLPKEKGVTTHAQELSSVAMWKRLAKRDNHDLMDGKSNCQSNATSNVFSWPGEGSRIDQQRVAGAFTI